MASNISSPGEMEGGLPELKHVDKKVGGPDDSTGSSEFSIEDLSKVTLRRKNTAEDVNVESRIPHVPVTILSPQLDIPPSVLYGTLKHNEGDISVPSLVESLKVKHNEGFIVTSSDESQKSNPSECDGTILDSDVSNLSAYSKLIRERDNLDNAYRKEKGMSERLSQLNAELSKKVDKLSKDLERAKQDRQLYYGQYLELMEQMKVQQHEFNSEKLKLTMQLDEVKCDNSDLMTSVKAIGRVNEMKEEENELLRLEVQSLKLQLTALSGGATNEKSITDAKENLCKSARESILKKAAMPNVKSIVQSIERQHVKPTVESVAPAAVVPTPQLPSPQREVPLPLRDQQLRDNKQTTKEEKKDPLHNLMEKYNVASIRNALLIWCQGRINKYPNIEITNFSSCWFDGLALCALLHTYLPDKIPFSSLTANNRKHNFTLAVKAAESVGIPNTLNVAELVQEESADWQKILPYVKEIYKHFEQKS